MKKTWRRKSRVRLPLNLSSDDRMSHLGKWRRISALASHSFSFWSLIYHCLSDRNRKFSISSLSYPYLGDNCHILAFFLPCHLFLLKLSFFSTNFTLMFVCSPAVVTNNKQIIVSVAEISLEMSSISPFDCIHESK